MTAVDPLALRQALGSFVTGVTIVTARDPAGEPVGLTVSSFNSVSLDPPLVLWSLSLKSASLPSFREARSWAVHVLSAGQEAMSARFATPGADRFADLALADGPEGAPQLPDFAARFGCAATFEYEGGDHAIFVGHVADLQRREAEPLVYHGGRYGRVAGAAEQETALFREEGGLLALTADGRGLIAELRDALAAGRLAEEDRALLADLYRRSAD
ncbi:flavin reductase family protein [Sphingomonas mesophila]|uniref:flavin reductase family protein n=1 Tax=Sphingomonas mesophila TaxID=2303576 RepID=UPI000E56A3D6|nr:flavin reductase family protein [Sphingomonas mesophila]